MEREPSGTRSARRATGMTLRERLAPRRWATKLIIGAFLLMAGTGVLMFFELDRGVVVVVHQWSSWVLLIGATGHLISNVRLLKSHLKAPRGALTLALFGVVLVLSCFSWGMITGPQLEQPIEQALVEAPFSALTRISRVDPATVSARLRAIGIDAASELSIGELARRHHQDENRLLGLVFLPEVPPAP